MSSAAVTAAPKKDDATWSDCVAAVHRVEHAAKELPVYADRLALCNELYALIATVATQTEAKAKAALSARHTAASAVDPKFAASAKAQVHSGGSGGSATPFKHEYAPPATAEELQTFRLEVHLGPRCDDPAREVPHSGDKLSSSQFTGQWRRSTLRWGPPTSDGIAAELVSLWPKTPAQVAARLATPHEFPPISNPTGMWLMRDTAGDGQSSSTFYVVDGAYRMAYLADPAHKPKYAVSWPCFTIENEPRFEFFAHNWNAKRLTPTVASPAVPPSHTATPNPTPAATPTAKASVTSADAKVAAK